MVWTPGQRAKAEIKAKIEAEPAPLPTGPFRVIVADPPWACTKRVEDGTHRGERPYPADRMNKVSAPITIMDRVVDMRLLLSVPQRTA